MEQAKAQSDERARTGSYTLPERRLDMVVTYVGVVLTIVAAVAIIAIGIG